MNSGDLTAVATIILALVTLTAVLTTIAITRKERRISREREQYAEAYLVQVVLGDAAVEGKGSPNAYGIWTAP